jgi:hypothetical protein
MDAFSWQSRLQKIYNYGTLDEMGRTSKILLSFFFSVSFLYVSGTTMLWAQSAPEQGSNEIQVWAGGGHSVPGGTSDTEAFDAGVRYGWVITGEHLPSLLRGRFEYTVDAVPVYLIFQPANTAYGAGFNPLGLKWNFVRRGRFSPYFELSGGVLFSSHDIPTYTNNVNFTPSAALGTHILGEKYNWSIDVRYLHISNAGLGDFNPGLNTVQVRLGVGRFWKKK